MPLYRLYIIHLVVVLVFFLKFNKTQIKFTEEILKVENNFKKITNPSPEKIYEWEKNVISRYS